MTKDEQLKMLQKRMPTIMGSEKFSQADVIKKLNEMRRTTPAGSRGSALLTPLYEALSDPEVATAYLAPMSTTKPEAVARVKAFSDTVKNEFLTPKAATAAPATATTPAPTTPQIPEQTKTADNVKTADIKTADIRTTGAKTKSVSERITELQATGKKLIGREEAVPAGYEFVSTIAGQKVIAPLEKTATGETIPEVSQESLRKSLATRTGPDYAAMSEVDLTGRARQAQDVITGKTETGNVEQKTGAYSEYRQIQQALAAKKAAAAAAAPVVNKAAEYGSAASAYQANLTGAATDAELEASKQKMDTMYSSMSDLDKAKASGDLLRKARGLPVLNK